MCKDQQNAVLTDGETNAQKKEWNYVPPPWPAAGSMLKYNRHYSHGTDKLRDISIIKSM